MFYRYSIRLYTFLAILLSLCSKNVVAQPTLPDMVIVSQNGLNILTWNCQYDGIKSIAVLRSNDSNFNFTIIGYVKEVKKGVQYYLDGHPNAGTNWYKLNIVFGSNLAWTSNRIKIVVDSAQIARSRVLPPNDSLQKRIASSPIKTVKASTDTLSKIKRNNIVVTSTIAPAKVDTAEQPKPIPPPTIDIPDISEVNAYTYIKSQYVFTNPFTGHVNIEITDVAKYKYSIEFFDQADIKVLEVPKISESSVIIDKRNFQRTGLYKFELLKDKEKIETGYITIY